MKVAVSTWQHRIAPVFDASRLVWICEVDHSKKTASIVYDLQIAELSPQDRVQLLITHQVEILICGGLSWQLERDLELHNIHVIPNICGEVDAVLQAFIEDQLNESHFCMPGCRQHRRGRARRHRHGRSD